MLDTLLIFSAQYLPFLIATMAMLFMAKLKILLRRSAIALLLLASVVALVIDKTLNQIVFSPRPFMIEDIIPLFPHVADNGFPSEHVLFAMVIASVVFVYNRKLGVVLGILAIIVGLARVAAGVHHPIDVLGGIAIAIVSVLGALYVIYLPKVQSLLKVENDKNLLF